jgi:ABC-type Mn2+/Zn2+ transport system permease subunit
MAAKFDLFGFVWRFALALALVLLTFNPSGYSFFHWVRDSIASGTFDPVQALAGVALAIGWVMFLKATHRSLGSLGLILTSAFFAALVWLLIDRGILRADSSTAISWIVLVCIAAILAVGMSWSHIRRRLSGQVDVDDVDD